MKSNMQNYLVQQYNDRGEKIFARQQHIFKDCVSQIKNKTESQRKTMITKILPRIALYKALLEDGCPELCSLFCDNDNILYDNLNNILFVRNGTIALGNKKCDFCFKRS